MSLFIELIIIFYHTALVKESYRAYQKDICRKEILRSKLKLAAKTPLFTFLFSISL